MKYNVKRDANQQWYWVLYASNGKALSRSSESYIHQEDCLHCLELNKASESAPVIVEAPNVRQA